MEENRDFESAETAPSTATTSVDTNLEGASTIETPPPNGDYDVTVVSAEVKAGKSAPGGPPSQSLYLNAHFQLDTAPAKDRHVFDMLLIRLKDGSFVGTQAAFARNYTAPNIAAALCDLAKLPRSATLLKLGVVAGLQGLKLRASFRGEKQDDGEVRLRCRRILGKPTGKGFEAPAAKRANGKSDDNPF